MLSFSIKAQGRYIKEDHLVKPYIKKKHQLRAKLEYDTLYDFYLDSTPCSGQFEIKYHDQRPKEPELKLHISRNKYQACVIKVL